MIVLSCHFRFCVCLYWGFMSRGQNNLWCAHLVAFTCQPSRKVKEGPTKYNSEPNNLMNKVFFSLHHSVRGHEPFDHVGHGHVDLIDLDLDGPEHVDLGTRQKLRRRGKKGKRRRKQNYNKDNKKTREQGHFSSLGTFRLWPSCSVTVIQINSGTINTIMKVVVDHCTKI